MSHSRNKKWELRLLGGSLLLVAVVYAFLAHHLAGFGSLWSPDTGPRFAMIRNWLEHGNLVHLHYPQASADPEWRLHPLAEYLAHTPKGICTVYPPLFPLLAGVPYLLFGFVGLALPSLHSGVATLAIIYRLAHHLHLRIRSLLPLVLGLATPLVLYSVVFWDHSLQMLLTAAALLFLFKALERNDGRYAAAAGATLGLGAWIHEALLPVFGALFIATIPLGRSQLRVLCGFGGGFLLLVDAWFAGNWWLYGTPGGPHLLGPNNLAHPFHIQQMLSGELLYRRASVQLIGEPVPGQWEVVFGCLLAIYTVSMWGRTAVPSLTPVLQVAAALIPVILVTKVTWSQGLFATTPLFIPALSAGLPSAIHPEPQQDSSVAADFWKVLLRAAVLFVLAVLITPKLPEMSWGSRYLLTGFPIFALLAAGAVEWQLCNARGLLRYLVVGSVGVLVAVSLFSQYRGFQAICDDLEYSRQLVAAARAVRSPVLVTDAWWLGCELAAKPLPSTLLLVRDVQKDRETFFSGLKQWDIDEFTYLGTQAGLQSITDAGLRHDPPFERIELRTDAGLTRAVFRARSSE